MMPDGRIRVRRALLTGFALILFIGFCVLGSWQLHRRHWKLDLIAHIERQLQQLPAPAPGRESWPSIGPAQVYLPLTATGRFLHDRETFVQAMTAYGSGYWLLTPLRTERGFVVLVNRGFVDSRHRDPATRRKAQFEGTVRIAGLLRLSEPQGRLLQSNDAGAGRWYSRDVEAIGIARDLDPYDLAPYFIDAGDAPNPGGWPVGGLTVLSFRNAHLGYALTWYALALMTALGTLRIMREPMEPVPGEF